MTDHLSHTPILPKQLPIRTIVSKILFLLSFSSFFCLGFPIPSSAAILSKIQFDWSYDTTLPGLMGYTIYQENQPIANITDPYTLSSEIDVYLEVGAQNTFIITAFDNLGNESNPSPPYIVDVPPEDDTGNIPPVAIIAISALSGPAPLTVDVSASKSIDYDGIITSYNWNFGDGGSSSFETDFHSFDFPGSYTVILEVTDDAGGRSSTQSTVIVTDPDALSNQPPSPAIYTSTNNGPTPLDVLFDGTDSTDPDGSIINYFWDFGDGSSANGIFVNYTYGIIGTFTGKLTVTDDGGASASDQTLITVVASDPLNAPPVAVINASPVTGTTPLTTIFSGASSTDSDGTIISYNWDFGDGSVASGTDVSHQYIAAGTYTATLTVMDDMGGTGQAQTIISAEEEKLPTTVILTDDFSTDSSSSYTNINGTLSVANGTAHGSNWQTTLSYHNLALGSNDHWVEAKVSYSGVSDSAGLIARVDKTNNTGYAAYFAVGKINLNRFAGTNQSWVASSDGPYGAGTYDLRIVISGSTIQVYVDGALKIEKTDTTYSQGQYAGMRIYRGSANVDVTCDDLKAGIGSPPPFPFQNNPPVAQNTSFTTLEDTSANGTFIFSDLDGDPLTASIVTNGTLGTATVTNPLTGTYTYTPSLNAFGSDSFTYKVNDGQADSNIATISVTITAVNDLPIAQADTATTNEDELVTINVLANDTDIDGDLLSITSVGQPAHGTATISNNQVLYTPAANYYGLDSFNYQISDSQGGSEAGVVNVTIAAVNDPPTATDSSLAVLGNNEESGTLTASDQDGDPLTFSLVSNGSLGTAILTNPATGTYTYTPDPNVSGTDTFTFKVNDGSIDSNIATVTVSIEAATTSDLADDFSLDSSANYSSIAGGITVSGGSAHGLNWRRTSAFHTTPLASSDHWVEAVVTYSGVSDSAGLLARVDNLKSTGYFVSFAAGRLNLNSFTSTSQLWLASQNGAYPSGSYHVRMVVTGNMIQVYVDGVLKIEKSDSTNLTGQHVGLYFYRGSANTDVTADNFMAGTNALPPVQTTNSAPVATDSAISLIEDTPTSAFFEASDPDNDPLTYEIINSGSLGTAVLIDPATGSFTYTPAANSNGTDLVTFQASDHALTSNIASVIVAISAVNDPPVAVNDIIVGNEDETSSIAVLANDSDIDDTTLAITIPSPPLQGSARVSGENIIYTPNENWAGQDSLVYTITDAMGASASADVAITITAVNDAPLSVAGTLSLEEDSQKNGLLAASDIENDPLTYSLVNNGSLGTAMITDPSAGAYTYTPNNDANGTDIFSFKVNDGSLDSNSASISVTITPVNDAPHAVSDNIIIDEEQVALIAVLANDEDIDGDPLTISTIGTPLHGSAILSGDRILYTPETNYSGNDSFSYTIADPAGSSASANIAITINPINDLPVAQDGTLVVSENNAGNGTLVANDLDNDPLTFDIVSNGSLGTAVLTDSASGSYTYTPNSGVSGSDTFTFQASDGQALSNIAAITVTIEPVIAKGAISDDFSINTSGDYTSISGSLTVSQDAAHGQNWRRTMAFHANDLQSSDHWVEADVQYNGAADSAGVMARIDPTKQTGYFTYFAAGRIHLNRFDGTTLSWVASQDSGFSEGTYRVRINVIGSTIQVYVNDVLKINKTDTTYPTGNHVGIYIYRGNANTDVTADNLSAEATIQ